MDCIQEQMSISYTFPGKLVACCGLLNFEQIIAVESEALAHYVQTNKFSEPLLFAVQN